MCSVPSWCWTSTAPRHLYFLRRYELQWLARNSPPVFLAPWPRQIIQNRIGRLLLNVTASLLGSNPPCRWIALCVRAVLAPPKDSAFETRSCCIEVEVRAALKSSSSQAAFLNTGVTYFCDISTACMFLIVRFPMHTHICVAGFYVRKLEHP